MPAPKVAQPTEFIIYAYQDFEAGRIGHNKWRVLSVLPEQEQALKTAHDFYETQDYEKIEIKKKFFDHKSKRYIASTLKTLEKKKIGPLWMAGFLTGITLLPALYFVVFTL